ncbi:MAG: hypothetical protein M1824_001120 [Vezdaea acicularis]|nr:MAG: hypothetical protein M1824_001120 [Vezdaea acicularis]
MAGTEETYHLTREDLRKAESKVSQKNDGVIPKDSEVSILKSIIDKKKDQNIIEERVANLPLPEQPPGSSDLVSSDARRTGEGSGRISEDIAQGDASSAGLRQPATAESSARIDGETWKTNTAP